MATKPKDLFDFLEPDPRLLSPDDIFERADAELLLKAKENRYVERKTASFSGSSLGEYICMWANTAPYGGLIVLGQRDAGSFEGCLKLSQKQINDREKCGHTFCPDARVRTKQVLVTNADGAEDFIILFRVPYVSEIVVKDNKGRAFVRKGDSCVELKPDEVRELQVSKGQSSFEEQPCALKYPDDFDKTAVADFVAKVRAGRQMSPDLSMTEVLDLRRLGTLRDGTFTPNYALALLFAKDPIRLVPGCKIRFQRFEGEEQGTGSEYNAVRNDILEGTVPSLLQQIEKTLDSQLRTFAPLDSKNRFYPMPEYPKTAWYEAVVNACVHRSYGNGMKTMPIFVKMFDDKLIIESPGPFPPHVTPSNIYDMHVPRNPQIMDALYYLNITRCEHEGTRRIRRTMAELQLPAPEFKEVEDTHAIVRVTLRNNKKQRRAYLDKDVSNIVSAAIAQSLSEDERRVLNWVATHQKITVSDCVRLLNTYWQRADALLRRLAKDSKVLQHIRFKKYEKHHRDHRAYYRLRSSEELPEGAFEEMPPERTTGSATQS